MPSSISENEEDKLRDACTVLRLSQKETRVEQGRLLDLGTRQLACVMALLEPPFGLRDVMDMGGDLASRLN